MSRFVILSLGFMAFGFYELSGGADFDPEAEAALRLAERGGPREVVPKPQKATPEPVMLANAAEAIQGQKPAVGRLALDGSAAAVDLPVTRTVPRIVTARTAVGLDADVPQPERNRALGLTALMTRPFNESLVNSAREVRAARGEVMTEPVAATLPAIIAPPADLRRVKVSRANMRNGPGTRYNVVGRLVRDTEVEVVSDAATGWVKLKVLETGRVGWISAKLLTPQTVAPVATDPQAEIASAD